VGASSSIIFCSIFCAKAARALSWAATESIVADGGSLLVCVAVEFNGAGALVLSSGAVLKNPSYCFVLPNFFCSRLRSSSTSLR